MNAFFEKILSLFKKKRIKEYKLLETIREENSTNVFRCKRKVDDMPFVIKVLQQKDAEAITRFNQEIEVMNGLSGVEGVIPIVDYDTNEHWYVMPEYQSIESYIENYKKSLKLAEDSFDKNSHIDFFVDAFIQLAEILEAVHEKNYSHRDIKPSNIYYQNEKFYFGDFGVVDVPENNPNVNNKRIYNTISPEVFANVKNGTSKSDVYSLAKSLWICLALDGNGFDGRYNSKDKAISLLYKTHLFQNYLVDILEILSNASQEDPQKRPTIKEFKERLIHWKGIDHESKVQQEWAYLIKNMDNVQNEILSEYTDVEKIINTLDFTSKLSSINCAMVTKIGWDNLVSVEKTENNYAILNFKSGYSISCKPKKLTFRGSHEEIFWSYFFFDFENLPSENSKEKPGYDSIVIVSDACFYCSIKEIADGRHDILGEEKFFDYTKNVRKMIKNGLTAKMEMAQIKELVAKKTPVK